MFRLLECGDASGSLQALTGVIDPGATD